MSIMVNPQKLRNLLDSSIDKRREKLIQFKISYIEVIDEVLFKHVSQFSTDFLPVSAFSSQYWQF